MTNTNPHSSISPKLLERLICPISRGKLDYDAEKNQLISEKAGVAFPVKDGIPILLEDEAVPLEKQ